MDTAPTRVEQFNQAIRGAVTIALCLGFLYGFWAAKISGEVFTAVFSGVIGFWFATRQSVATTSTTKPNGNGNGSPTTATAEVKP